MGSNLDRNTSEKKFFVDVYRETPAKKTNVLKLEMSGRFAINVVDSLVVVHHQASKVRKLKFFTNKKYRDSKCFVIHISPLKE